MPFFKNEKHKILFVHIPKTGGTTIEEYMSRYFDISFHTIGVPASLKITPQHFQINEIKLLLNGKEWDYAFAVVRNPYERLISEYFYITESTKKRFGKRPDFSKWVMEQLAKYRKNPFVLDNHIRPQYQFIDDDVEIFKFERGIHDVISKLSEKFNLSNFDKIEKKNKSNKDIEVDFSLEALEAVNEFYKKDFELFSYEIKHKNLNINNR